MVFARKLIAVAGALAGVLCIAANAQESAPDFYKEPGIYPNRDYVNQHATENVDPFTGSLQIQSTDVYLPGEGGFDLKVVPRMQKRARIRTCLTSIPSPTAALTMYRTSSHALMTSIRSDIGRRETFPGGQSDEVLTNDPTECCP